MELKKFLTKVNILARAALGSAMELRIVIHEGKGRSISMQVGEFKGSSWTEEDGAPLDAIVEEAANELIADLTADVKKKQHNAAEALRKLSNETKETR